MPLVKIEIIKGHGEEYKIGTTIRELGHTWQSNE